MRKLFAAVTALLALTVVTSPAQMVPDNDRILPAIIDRASPFFYSNLMDRYLSGDTTLTHEDYHYLYYGYAFQDEYRPLEPIVASDHILMVMEVTGEPEAEQAREIIRYAEQVMQHDPFSPRDINFLTYAYGILGDTINERINADRFEKIIHTIENSGTGLNIDSPWHVLWFSHVNDLLASRGQDISGRRLMTSKIEFVGLMIPDGKVKGYYVDFSRIYWKRPESLPEKRSSGLTLNGIPLRKRYPHPLDR